MYVYQNFQTNIFHLEHIQSYKDLKNVIKQKQVNEFIEEEQSESQRNLGPEEQIILQNQVLKTLKLFRMPAFQQYELYKVNGHFEKADAQLNLIMTAVQSFNNQQQRPLLSLSLLLKKSYQSKIEMVDILIKKKSQIDFRLQQIEDKIISNKFKQLKKEQQLIYDQIGNKVRDSELFIQNLIEIKKFQQQDIYENQCDLLEHYLKFNQFYAGIRKVTDLADQILSNQNITSRGQNLYCQAYFLSEKKPFSILKSILKKAILKHDNKVPLSELLHNLAVINIAEIEFHNDSIEKMGGELGKYMQSKQASEDIIKSQQLQKDKLQKEKIIKDELNQQLRMKQIKERRVNIRKLLNQKLQEIVKLPKIQNNKGVNKFSGNFHVARTAKKIIQNQLQKKLKFVYQKEVDQQNDVKIEDLLENSFLEEQDQIEDLVQHLSTFKDQKINPQYFNQIPTLTKECFIEHLVLKRINYIDSNIKPKYNEVLNEILPLLFVSLKLRIQDNQEIKCLNDFMTNDKSQELLLGNQNEYLSLEQIQNFCSIHKTLELVARIYSMDSKKYINESEYWIQYSRKILSVLRGNEIIKVNNHENFKILLQFCPFTYDKMVVHTYNKLKQNDQFQKNSLELFGYDDPLQEKLMITPHNLRQVVPQQQILSSIRRTELLWIASLIDQGNAENAFNMLLTIYNNWLFREDEKDIKILVMSLLGILGKKKQFQMKFDVTKILEKAKEASIQIKNSQEKFGWMILIQNTDQYQNQNQELELNYISDLLTQDQ